MANPHENPSRRTFLDYVLYGGTAGLAAAILYPVARYLVPPDRGGPGTRSLVLDPNDPAQVDPETRVFVFGNEPGILVRGPGGEWKAFSGVCTHLSCTVRFKADTNQIWCPCHNGLFDLNGRNVPGTPPPRPLAEFRVSERPDGKLVIRKGRSS
jgi:Rieske Fe-S protein